MSKRRSVITLVVAGFLLIGANFLFTAHYVNSSQAAARQQQAAQQAAARRAAELVEEKICADVGAMAEIPPPAGPATANPSRAYEQAEHRTWQRLIAGLDCPPTKGTHQ